MNAGLLRAIRKVIRCDSDPVRRELFERLRRTRASVRLAYGLHRRLGRGWLSSLFVASYGLKGLLAVRMPGQASLMLGVASQENARRRLRQIAALLDAGELRQVRCGPSAAARPQAFTTLLRTMYSPGHVRRYLRVVRRINRGQDFLVSCRVAGLLGTYAAARGALALHRFKTVVVSSDSNPEEIAFTTAARALGRATVFVSHAYPTAASPPLDFDLSVIEGEAAHDMYRRLGPVRGAVCFAGIAGQSVPLDAARFRRATPVIGIFAPKVVVWDTFARLVEDARSRLQARQIVIRWHPSVLERPRLERLVRDTSFLIETPASDSLPSVVARCDWVIADADSNVHLEVLKLGVPTAAVARLGIVPLERADLYGFVANGLIPAPLPSLAELNPDELAAFFDDEWSARFRRYDAGYLRPEAELAEDVRRALRRASPAT